MLRPADINVGASIPITQTQNSSFNSNVASTEGTVESIEDGFGTRVPFKDSIIHNNAAVIEPSQKLQTLNEKKTLTKSSEIVKTLPEDDEDLN